ncbi:MAG: hypothetical protein J0M15_10420 [Deltaproteobacteria bacterium]|nr:hypothetical protein [Deltaproteobacteria bacterium]
MNTNEVLVNSLLDLLKHSMEEKSKEHFFSKYYQIRNLTIDQTTPGMVQYYKDLLKRAIYLFNQDRNFNSILSSIISLSYYLIQVDQFDEELFSILDECYHLPDVRVKANTITAFGEFDPNSELFKENINSKYNRIAAEAIIVESKKHLTDSLIIKIEEFLKSPNPFFISSGIYIVGQLIEFYKSHLPPEIHKLDLSIKKIEFYCKHPHEMIRKRALKTAEVIKMYYKKSA